MADLLLDEGIGQNLAMRLRAQGFNVYHALEFHGKGTHDHIVFREAQQRSLTIFTWNRDDYVLLSEAWRDWGLGDHHGIIARQRDQPQLGPAQLLQVLAQYCRDSSSFINRIELF
jgi:hypothetical protein